MIDVIRDLAIKHGLTNAEVMAVTERVFTEMIASFYDHDVITDLDPEDGLTATLYRKNMDGTVNQIQIDPLILKRFYRGKVPKVLERELARLRVVKDVQHLGRHKHQICWGEIIGRQPNGTLLVEAEIDGTTIVAECPPDLIGCHERETIEPGQRRAFHIRQVEPIMLNGTPRLRVVLDRVSKTLPEQLLKARVPGNSIQCQVRYVGAKSFIRARTQLPKPVKVAVEKELGEILLINQKPPGKWRKGAKRVIKRS